ncbi:hypothetical protein [Pseudarthrobacter sp. NIBRBAC000502772]|uniref:hypothetical protein n=1 Tax=Pseudarthrobacter sp. NIBRBAC000502772 TaxID=2590775 RepID=UPI001FEF3D40|nr:hypothetical protein [Pseudarthrobacter sp. NIBRBAC000502772]
MTRLATVEASTNPSTVSATAAMALSPRRFRRGGGWSGVASSGTERVRREKLRSGMTDLQRCERAAQLAQLSIVLVSRRSPAAHQAPR